MEYIKYSLLYIKYFCSDMQLFCEASKAPLAPFWSLGLYL